MTDRQPPSTTPLKKSDDCPVCHGVGTFAKAHCGVCNGTGKRGDSLSKVQGQPNFDLNK